MSNKSRLRWRCRRGIREMDILFQRFMDDCYDTLSDEDKNTFEIFLNEPDLDILNWVMGRTEAKNSDYQGFITAMQEFNSRK